ncbi:helix-turn-helix transcriptional regulator [Arenicella xantha]|uniref:AraC family transcriptional regulator n=1 Tax=Arenicella xantha TaxID=644221 RepID=A0A395JFV0_9GAMM|nr:helix-turn-helix transcriptional regulator [Arenicella xantha]RBP48726.1 AraC family transcriptional regulator [Arenicella xantha]
MSDPVFNIHDTLLLATAFQSMLFVLLILVVKHERHLSDYFLVGFFLAQVVIPMHILVNYGEAFREIALATSPSLFHAFELGYWLEGPLLLWYTRSILYKEFRMTRIDLLFLLPAIGFTIYILISFYFQDIATKLLLLEQQQDQKTPSLLGKINGVREILRVFFGVLCIIDIRQARQQIRDRFSNIEKIDFGWLSYLVIAFTIVRVWVVVVLIITFFAPNLSDPIFNNMGLAGNYLTFALITTLMFYSLQRSTLFDHHLTEEPAHAEEPNFKIDDELTKRIEQHMQTDKPHLIHLLNLEQLANQLSMHPRTLSVTIKHHFKTNFYEFVNSYRIEEAKRLLSDPAQRHKTMIEISGECGFNSKATYNTFFKKLVGATPTQYRSKQLDAQST